MHRKCFVKNILLCIVAGQNRSIVTGTTACSTYGTLLFAAHKSADPDVYGLRVRADKRIQELR